MCVLVTCAKVAPCVQVVEERRQLERWESTQEIAPPKAAA